MRRITQRLSYANVTATLALFMALGGTSYALSLPRNSVGSAQLRTNSVGPPEIRRGAIRSTDVDDRSLRLRDISVTARAALKGQIGPQGPPGPSGPTLKATINSAGQIVRGNALGSDQAGLGSRVIGFAVPTANCVPIATLTSTPGGVHPTPPPGARIATMPGPSGAVLIKTWAPDDTPTDYPFNLVVAC
jgi:hypothetical protein